jgi:5-methylcytosine-specific restriction endonuclease McrA
VFPATVEYFPRHRRGACGLNAQCHACKRAANRLQSSSDIDRARALSRARYLRWAEKHPEKVGESSRKFNKANPERRKATALKYALSPRGRERGRVHVEKRRALKLANGTEHYTVADVRRQYALQHGKCHWCDKPVGDKYHIDHIIPLSKGGDNSARNICIACPFCNRSKSDKLPHEWSDRLF